MGKGKGKGIEILVANTTLVTPTYKTALTHVSRGKGESFEITDTTGRRLPPKFFKTIKNNFKIDTAARNFLKQF